MGIFSDDFEQDRKPEINYQPPKKENTVLQVGVKAAFLLLFMVPVAYLARGQQLGVSSLFFVKPTGEISGSRLLNRFFVVPITQSPCSTWLGYYGSVSPGLWLMDPFGGLQVLVSGQVWALASF